MKILFCVRHNFYSSPGGVQVQILKTKEHIENLGISCDLTTTPHGINFNKYDILHLTDLTWVYDNLEYLRQIERQEFKGKKVLSTIYWPFEDYALNGAPLIQRMIYKVFGINGFEFAKSLAKYIAKGDKIYLHGLRQSYIKSQKQLLRHVDWLLPNAQLEFNALEKRLTPSFKSYSVINNAIDIDIFDEIISNEKISKDNNLITFVGRIDARKNQIMFLKAMMGTTYQIRFIGNPGPNSKSYLRELQRLARKRGNVEIISHIPQERVFKHMLEAKVNVLTSWIETPGLVSIEAAYAGCNIVVSRRGSVSEYFQNYAYYCEPDDLQEIRRQTQMR